MEMTNGQKLALALAMKKSAEALVEELRPIVDAEVLEAYYNAPNHPDRQVFAFANDNAFAEVGRITIKRGKGRWEITDPEAFNAWAIEAGVAIPYIFVYPEKVAECAKALDRAGLSNAYYMEVNLPKDYQRGFEDNDGARPIWKATGEIVDGLEWAEGKISTMVTGCTIDKIRKAERLLGAPIIGPALLEGGAE